MPWCYKQKNISMRVVQSHLAVCPLKACSYSGSFWLTALPSPVWVLILLWSKVTARIAAVMLVFEESRLEECKIKKDWSKCQCFVRFLE